MLEQMHSKKQGWPLKALSTGIFATLILSGCGGGGSGDGGAGGGSNSVEYTGNEQAANLDNQNAPAFANNTFTGLDSATNVDVIGAQDINTNQSNLVVNTMLNHTKSLSQTVGNNPQAFAGAPKAIVNLDVTSTCSGGGNVTFNGSYDDVAKTGSLSVMYNGCKTDDVEINGSAALEIRAYNADIDEHTDVELIFNNLHIVSLDPNDDFDVQVGANIRGQIFYTTPLDPYTKRASINMTLANNASGAQIKIENYLVDVVFDRYSAPTEATADISGRLYHHTHGYVDIDTITPLHYSAAAIDTFEHELIGNPDGGGPLVYTGASNRKIRLTPVDATLVNVAVDINGDDFYEYSVTLPWSELRDDYVNDNAPVANAGADATITLGQTAQLDGGQSSDADFNLIDYTWVVTDQPVGSDAGLTGGNSINPTLTPDTAGSYTVELTVNDGWFTDTDNVVVTVNP